MIQYYKDIQNPDHYIKYDIDNDEWFYFQRYNPSRGWIAIEEEETEFIERDLATHWIFPMSKNEIKQMFINLL